MLFNSFEFLVFFVVVVTAHFLLPHRWRWMLLLGSSCLFYMAFIPSYILILAFTILVDYVAGVLIEGSEGPRRRRFLALSLIANIGVLAFFKYYSFSIINLAAVTNLLGLHWRAPILDIVLPIGLSFHTFQAMSYTIEVYRRRQPAEWHLGRYALYVMFFPQLVAGPIERPQNLLPQFSIPKHLEPSRLSAGLQLMLWGVFKKVVIADSLAQIVNRVYGAPHAYSGPWLVFATVLFSVQIYCDFSGYSGIAVGCAKILGYDLMTNFRAPYFADSIGEFWRRWHISLSTWFRDYLFLPLNYAIFRRAEGRRFLGLSENAVAYVGAMMATMVVSGLWHGANWTFVVWGSIHGIFIVCRTLFDELRGRRSRRRKGLMRRRAGIATTFLLVTFAWVFFRAESLESAIYILTHFASLEGFTFSSIWGLGLPRFELLVALCAVVVLFVVESFDERLPPAVERAWNNRAIRWGLYLATVYSVVFFGVFGRVNFIYFQF